MSDPSPISPPGPMSEAERCALLFLQRWQEKLLPFMLGTVAVVGLFFLVVTVIQFKGIDRSTRHDPSIIAEHITQAEQQLTADGRSKLDLASYVQWKVDVLLRQDAMQSTLALQRASFLASIWTRYLGFLTGMILALLGATFILGQLSIEGTRLRGEAQSVKLQLATSSPGIILALLGVLLIVFTKVEYRGRFQDSLSADQQPAGAQQDQEGSKEEELPDESFPGRRLLPEGRLTPPTESPRGGDTAQHGAEPPRAEPPREGRGP